MRACLNCGVELTKKPGPGRWPKWCADCPKTHRKPKRTVRCPCGAILETHRGSYCSNSCRMKEYNQRPAAKERNRLRVHVRRARQFGVDSERFDSSEIFDRDGWVCGICELPVDPAARWPEPGAVTLDHIVPLARGGAHTRANTQCAHAYCNSVKGARPVA